MPELNRDKERLYRPGRLSLWFLVASGLLFASLVWMVVADYARPWKRTQKDYYAKRARVLEAKRQEARAALEQGERNAKLTDLGRRLREAREALDKDPEVVRLRGVVRDAELREKDLEAEFKGLSGEWAEKKYEVEKARHDLEAGHGSPEHVERAADEYAALTERRAALARRISVPAAERIAASQRLGVLEEEKKRLEKEYAAERKDVTDAESQLAAARTAGESAWRNAFGIDFLVPTIRPIKVVNPHVHDNFNFATNAKVDMCMTCHMGAGDPLMAGVDDAEAARFGVEPLFRAHPRFDLILGPTSPHPMEKIGCTVCHAGRGWSLDFLRAAHTPRSAEQRREWEEEHGWTPARWVDFPMLPTPYVEGQCFKCHAEGLYHSPQSLRSELAPEGEPPSGRPTGTAYREFESLHRYVLVPDKQNPRAPKTVKKDQRDVPVFETLNMRDGTPLYPLLAKAPDPVADWDEVPGAAWRADTLTTGMRVASEYGCFGCHLMKGGPDPGIPFPNLPGFPREQAPGVGGAEGDGSVPREGNLIVGKPKVAWDLSRVGHKVTHDFLRKWIRNPSSYRIDTRMPAFYFFREHDDLFVPKYGANGQPVDRHVEPNPRAEDLVETEVEVEALAAFLEFVTDQAPAPTWPKPPEGDPRLGSKVFYTAGCYGCHLGPDRWEGEGDAGRWVPDDGARFALRTTALLDKDGKPLVDEETKEEILGPEELPQGPRLTALGSKIEDAGWLYDWLREPRHWWSATRMPNMRWQDETDPEGRVVRTADQRRADVVAFLMRGRDEAFEKQEIVTRQKGWTKAHGGHLDAMWREYYGKSLDAATVDARLEAIPLYPTAAAPPEGATETPAERLRRMGKLAAVGEKVVTSRGCFGCHAIPGTEESQPIGKDLSKEGTQDIHKFDFGFLHHELEHTRWAWIEQKIRDPRVFDRGRIKLWTEKLKMPKFNIRAHEQKAVTAFVLGLVHDEPIQPGAHFRPTEAERAIVAGRTVIERYGCNNCHTIEGEKGVVFAAEELAGREAWMLPPNLFGEGNRVQADWLFAFLKEPHDLRPGVLQRMPNFRLSDEEANALVAYFVAIAGRPGRTTYDPLDLPLDATPYAESRTVEVDRGGDKRTVTIANRVDEARALFEAYNCVTCHLRKGTPGADPTSGGQAPPFDLARARLRREWVAALLHDPPSQIWNTKMPAPWPIKARIRLKPGDTRSVQFPQFRFGLPDTATNDEVAEAQMEAVARYVIHHYEAPVRAPSAPAAGD